MHANIHSSIYISHTYIACDKEGEGEEDEVTVHEIRSKVYKMTKDKEGKAQWGDMGVGVLRLKKHKETGARRMLLRNSSTGKITIVSRFAVLSLAWTRADSKASPATELFDPLGYERDHVRQVCLLHRP